MLEQLLYAIASKYGEASKILGYYQIPRGRRSKYDHAFYFVAIRKIINNSLTQIPDVVTMQYAYGKYSVLIASDTNSNCELASDIIRQKFTSTNYELVNSMFSDMVQLKTVDKLL